MKQIWDLMLLTNFTLIVFMKVYEMKGYICWGRVIVVVEAEVLCTA